MNDDHISFIPKTLPSTYYLIIFFQRYIPLPCGQMFGLHRDNGEVVAPSIKINIYKMLCLSNQYCNQEGEKRKLTRLRVALCEAD